MPRRLTPLALTVALLALASGARGQALPDAFPALPDFAQPVDLIAAPEAGVLWVAEQGGQIWAIDEDPSASTRTLVLDLTDIVGPISGDGGLQSLALRPTGDALFVHVVTFQGGPLASVILRFRVRNNGTVNASGPQEVLRLDQPDSVHNGGKILWGPDGMLYVPMGDGGLDPGLSENAQDRTTLFGSVLRLDPPRAHAPGYAIPPDNPYVGNTDGWREEIWAYGLRNPWRSAFDASGRLWVADVGESDWEEVDLIARGANYGWDEMEGPACSAASCDDFVAPVFSYPHDIQTGGLSVTGGMVYRGTRAPALTGRYLLADLISHRLWSLRADDPSDVIDHGTVPGNPWIVAFGEGASGEMYAVSYSRGRILDIAAWAATDAEPPPSAGPLALQVAPNPASGAATVTWSSGAGGPARVEVIDALGRTVQTHTPLARSERQRLDLSTLAPGVYAVRVALPEGTATTRVTVAR